MIYIYRGYQVKPHNTIPTCYVVVTDGKGGKVPNVLTSLFTSAGIAKTQIDLYLENLERKNKNVQTVAESGA